MKNLTKITAAGAATLLTLALAACDTGGEDPTPTSTASTSPSASASASSDPSASPSDVVAGPLRPVTDAPESEEGAVESAFETLQRLLEAEDKRSVAGEGSMKEIGELAMDPRLAENKKYFESAEGDGIYAEGAREVELVDGFTTSMTYEGEEMPLHSVQLEVCNDTSGITYFQKDESEIEKPQLERVRATGTVIFDPEREQWLVQDYNLDEGNQEC